MDDAILYQIVGHLWPYQNFNIVGSIMSWLAHLKKPNIAYEMSGGFLQDLQFSLALAY